MILNLSLRDTKLSHPCKYCQIEPTISFSWHLSCYLQRRSFVYIELVGGPWIAYEIKSNSVINLVSYPKKKYLIHNVIYDRMIDD